MRGSFYSAIIASLLLLILVAAPAAAATISVSPDVVQKGGLITVSISGLNNGQTFSLNIDGTFVVVPNSYSSFQTNNFNMPFSLTSGTVSATTHGTSYTEFSVKPKGDKSYSMGDDADANGDFTISEAYTVKKGLYDFLKLEGTIRPGTRLLETQMNLYGTKQDPANAASSAITFNVGGMDNGEVRITAYVDGSQAMPTKIITLGSGVPVVTTATTTATPTATATTATTTATTTGTGTTTGTTTAVTTAPEATETAYSIEVQTTAGPQETVFRSADRQVSLKTYDVDYAAVMMVGQPSVPADWLMIGKAYAVAPDTLTFSPAATLSFVTPATANTYAYFIAERSGSEWTTVPCRSGSGTIDITISKAGTYALMAYKPESTIVPTVKGTSVELTTATPLVKETTNPKIASFAQAEPVQTTQSAGGLPGLPVDPVIVAGAVALGIALFAVMRK
ncbi:MAG TPA: hypothetical protein HA272_04010 [Methanoregula sp.]|nr:hypothetical protein [Methanoregula sp.]